MKSHASQLFRGRGTFIVSVLVLGFVLVLIRAVQFQLMPDPRLVKLASGKEKLSQQSQSFENVTSRGPIVDREGQELAMSVIVKSFFANPRIIANPERVAQKLAPLLDVPVSKLKGLLSQDKYFVWLKREVEDEIAQRIEALNVEGVYSRKESKRIYPNGDLARPLIGVAGIDGSGLEGLEKTYDAYLRSFDRVQVRGVRDALGRLLLFDDFDQEWFETHRVETTLDIRFQRLVEEELDRVIEEKNPQSAQAIMMDPKTGAILALASRDGSRRDRDGSRIRPVADVYEPGSTFKIILAAAAIEKLKMSPQSQIYGENGKLRVGNHWIKEYHEKKYAWLTLQDLLEVSSNVASAKIGLKLGNDNLASMIKAFGFGTETGIDMPGEASGLIRDSKSWRPIELANIAFGQGLAVTPIQMIRAIAAVANGGALVKPHLVSRVMGPRSVHGESVVIWTPDLETRDVLSPDQARTLTDMLVHVTETGSTGYQAAIPGYQIAGKTGTSQKLVEMDGRGGKKIKRYSSDASIVSFIGYVPAYDPAFVLLVLYDDPQGKASGGTLAAPSFKRIASRALGLMGITPESEKETAVIRTTGDGDSRFVGRRFEEVLKEIRSMPDEDRRKYDLIGFGTAVREEVSADQRVRVYFK